MSGCVKKNNHTIRRKGQITETKPMFKRLTVLGFLRIIVFCNLLSLSVKKKKDNLLLTYPTV